MAALDWLAYLGATTGLLIWLFFIFQKEFDFISPLGIFLIIMLLHWSIWPIYTVMSTNIETTPLSLIFNFKILDATHSDVFGVYAYAAISIIVYVFSFKHSKPFSNARIIFFPQCIVIRPNHTYKYTIALLGAVISWAAFLSLAQSKGGVSFYLTNIDSIRNNDFRGVAPYFYALQLGLFLLTYSAMDAWINSKRRVLKVLMISIGLIPCFLIGQRLYVLYVLLFALAIYNYSINRLRINFKLLLVVLLFALLNMAFIAYKTVGVDLFLESASEIEGGGVATLGFGYLVSRFSAPESLFRAMQIDGYLHIGDFGLSAISDLFVSLIPSSFREGYLTLGQRFNLQYYPEISGIGSGISAALPYYTGDAYVQWGVLGAVIYPFLIAVFYKNVFASFKHYGLRSLHVYIFYTVQLFVFTEIQSNALMNIFIFLIAVHLFSFARNILKVTNPNVGIRPQDAIHRECG